jgi:hypothetical protein
MTVAIYEYGTTSIPLGRSVGERKRRSRESGGRLEADDDAPDNAKRPQGPGHVRSL